MNKSVCMSEGLLPPDSKAMVADGLNHILCQFGYDLEEIQSDREDETL